MFACCMFVVSDRLSLRSVSKPNNIMIQGVCPVQDVKLTNMRGGCQEMGRGSWLIFDHGMVVQTYRAMNDDVWLERFRFDCETA